jgi:hypothetical protein
MSVKSGRRSQDRPKKHPPCSYVPGIRETLMHSQRCSIDVVPRMETNVAGEMEEFGRHTTGRGTYPDSPRPILVAAQRVR